MIMNNHIISKVNDSASDLALMPGLCELLIDAVHGGASVGFLAPLSAAEAAAYWAGVAANVGPGLHWWVVQDAATGQLLGSVQLAPCLKANGRHRAELQKLLVYSSARGQGLASRLMSTADAQAQQLGITLLVLDTIASSHAAAVYEHLGWQKSGEIPLYAANPDGSLHATAVYFKHLAEL
jgi:acetyltransferase